jgi:hypothetical protein
MAAYSSATKGGLLNKRMTTGLVLLGFAVASGCSNSPDTATTQAPTPATTPSTQTAATESAAPGVVGSWHRAQTCSEMWAAFDAAGLAESHVGWLQGNFYGGEPGPIEGDPCAGASGPLEHDHFFTEDGAFGSHDENGEEVDHGDYILVDEDTVGFPSHASEFGYDGELVVDFSIEDDVATFTVVVPESCVDQCADAHAWALSAFASGPWEGGEVPQ